MQHGALPWLSGALADRAGALLPAARAFLGGWLGERAPSFRGGSAGLVALCQHLEHWLELEQVDAEAERSFVEGAGALLGLLLLDHLGEGTHSARGGVHRVRLGRYGYFDPFAAIEHALDAPNVRAELARQVALAEAESRAEGPISRVVASFVRGLARERPELELADHFEHTLALAGRADGERIELDLRRAVESTRDQDAHAVENVTRRLISLLPGATPMETELDEARGRLVPRLARADALRDLSTSGHSLLVGTPLTDELSISLLLEYEGRARYVRQSELSAWGLNWADAMAIALGNLEQRSHAARLARADTESGPLFVARTGDGRDSARVLLPRLHGELRERMGPRVAIGIPHRDTFLACDGDNPLLVAALAERVQCDARNAPHRLSGDVFLLGDRGLSPFVRL